MSGFGPVGSFAVGVSGPATEAPDVVVTEHVGLGTAAASEAIKRIIATVGLSNASNATPIKVTSSNLTMTEAITAVPVKYLSANVRLAGTPRGIGEFNATATASVGFGAALAVVWQMLAEESISLVGQASGQPTKVARLVDALVASGTVSGYREAMAVLSAALAINSLVATGWRATASDQVNMSEAFRAQLAAAATVLDSVSTSGTAAASMRVTALLDDSLALDDSIETSLVFLETLGEDVLFFGSIRLGDDEYVGWVLNEGAPSEYRNFPFNGFAVFNGKYYGTTSDGLYLLEGDDDAGEPIEASIKTTLMDFGTGVLKRIPDVYVAFVGSDKLVLKVVTTGQRGEQVETIYTSDVPAGTALHNGRIRIGQGLKSRYWQFELSNVDGAEFEIDELAWRPMTLDRRL